jgi:alkyldihydroxyacetonephosphate synthase
VYFGFGYTGIPNDQVVKIYEAVEDECRDEIIKNGGSISHHHGVGKIRKRYVKRMIAPLGVEVLRKVKETVDPNNIMAINNTIFRYDGEEEEDLELIK